ncbi:MAG: hypothetical protein NC816_05640, partial [Candidatus Omnitrophica bacterium]|nr:hypothetical protein [Candidatus Omnitrophota bacterium]
FKLIIVAFILGYFLGSWFILEGKGLSDYNLEDLKAKKEKPQERKLTILNALNPFEPMNPGLYFILFAKPD